MSPLLQHLTSPEWTQVVKALLHTLWQATIVAVLLGLVLRRLANPVTRYRFSLAALVFVTGAVLVTWAVLNRPDTKRPTATPTIVPPPTQYVSTEFGAPAVVVTVTRDKTTPPEAHWTAWLAMVWIAGAAAMLLRAAIQVAGAERMRRSTRPLEDSRVAQLIAEAQRAVRLTRTIRVAVTDKLTSPAVVGVLVPTLILPLSLITALTHEQLRFVLLHELAHIRRGDYFANLFQLFAEALLFFNPAVWWISHQVRREREACCDALAIELSNAPADYARTLVKVAENILEATPAAATAFGDKRESSSLTERVQRMLVPGYRPSLRLTWRAMLAALFVGGTLLVLSAVGTRITVAAILSPRERIEQIEKKMTEYGEKPVVEPDDSAMTPEVKVSGRVRTADGSALPKVKWVNVYTTRRNYSGASSARMQTNGVFSVSTRSGRICAGLDLPGFAPAVAGPVDVEGTNHIENLDLILERGFDAPVTITDAETGAPISDAMVKARFWVRGMGTSIGKSRELRTDAVGKTALPQCSDSVALTLVVNAPGYEIIEHRIEKLNPQAPVHLKLQRGMPVSGVVLNKADNSPLAGATVRLIYEQGREEKRYQWTDEARVMARTDATGRFAANQLQRNTKYWLGVSAPGHESVIIGPLLAGTKDLRIPLGPELIVRGRVIGNFESFQVINGERCLSMDYSELFDNHSNGFQEWVPIRVVDGQATFQFTNPIPGRVTLSDGQGYREEREVTAPVDNWVVNLSDTGNFAAQRPKREVIFRFKHPSGVPPRGTVSVSVPDNLTPNHLTAHYDEKEIVNGEARVDIAIGGRTYVEPKRMVGYWFKHDYAGILVTNGVGPLVVEIPVVPAGAIYAQARNADGTLAGGLLFSVRELSRAASRTDNGGLGSSSDSVSGNAPRKWVSGPLPLGGTYQIVAWRGNSFCASQPITLTEEKPDAEVMLQFPASRTLTGRVLNPDGQAVRDAELNVLFTLPDNHGFGLKRVFTDSSGLFRIENATPGIGTYSVECASPGFMAERVNLHFEGQPQTIRLKHGKRLTGRVIEADTGHIIPNAEVRAMRVEGPDLPSQSTHTDADGNFAFTTLGNATYLLFVSDAKMEQQPKLRPGEAAPVTLTVTLYQWSKLKPKVPLAKGEQDSAAEKAIPTNVASNALLSALPKSLYEKSPGARIGFRHPVPLLFTIEVREDGSYWTSNKLKPLAELRDWLTETIRPGSENRLRIEVHTNAPIEAVRALSELCKELGVAEFGKTPTNADPPTEFFTRTYKVDPNTFYRALPQPVNPTNSAAAVRAFFTELGIDLNQEPGKPGRSVFFTHGKGLLMVRATRPELDAVERALQKLNAETTSTSTNPESSTIDSSRKAEAAKLVQEGRLLIELGKKEDAAIELNKALTIDPENKAARFYLGMTKKSQGLESPNSSSAFNGGNSTNLYVRTYKLDPNTFYQGLETIGLHLVRGTNVAPTIRDFFARLGADVSPPKNLFWNDRNGLLQVRATRQDLEVIESAIQVLNTTPPQVNIKATFVEVPAQDAERLLKMVFTNTPAGGMNGFTGILTKPQADKLMAEIKSTKSAEITSTPEVTTLSGRQAQIRMVDLQTIVTGLTPVMNGLTNLLPQADTMPSGSVLDVIPYVSADGFTVQMTIIPSVTEFVEYDDPGSLQFVETHEPTVTLPRMRVRQITTTAIVWDGQTIVLGNFPVKEVSKQPDGTKKERYVTSKNQKQLLVFVTPTIIDQAGNRMHAEDDMPFARDAIPTQTPIK